MKPLTLIFILVCVLLTHVSSANSTKSNDVAGSWQGTLTITPEKSMDLIFHFKQTSDGYVATIDIPKQQQFGLPFNNMSYINGQISLAMDMAQITYDGTLKDKKIIGTYEQGAFKAPLNLVPAIKTVERQRKVQDVVGDVPYQVEQVQFVNSSGGHKLAGTLTYPKGLIKYTTILLSGSGPTTRDADVFGHKIFTVLADQLTRQGIAVLRYDDRGVGESEGDYANATSEDFASDANAAYQFLREYGKRNFGKIGFVGHSEGGLIGAIATANNAKVDFFVSLAGPGTTGAQIIIDQSYYIQKLRGMDDDKLTKDDKIQKEIINAVVAGISKEALITLLLKHDIPEAQANAQATQLTSPWFQYFVKSDPQIYLTQVDIPMLALNGGLDSQVLPKQNIEGIQQSVKPDLLTTKIYPGLNHLFQPAKTGLPEEYGNIDITFSEQVSRDIVQWLLTNR